MADKYNPIVDTLVSTPLVNLASWTVAQKPGGASPVTVGTDDWQVPQALDTGAFDALFLGQNFNNALLQNIAVFDVRDRTRIKEFILMCNFADGLLDISNKVLTPVFPGVNTPFPAAGFYQQPSMLVTTLTYRIDNTAPIGVFRLDSAGGSVLTFNVPGFGIPLKCDYQEARPPNAQGIIAPVSDKGYVFTASMANVTNHVDFSTISIDPAYQTKRILVWAQMVVEHTYPLMYLPPAT